MILINQFPSDGSIIPFPDIVVLQIMRAVLALVYLSTLLDLLLLYALLKQRSIPVDTLFIISLTVSDLIFSVTMVIINTINAIYGGWAVGPDACFWEVILITASLGMSIVNVFLISAHRYLVIIFEHSISQLQAKIIIAISWLGLLALIGGISHIYSLSNGALSGLQNNFMYCYLALSSNDPVNQVVGSLIIFIISSVIIFIIFAYSSIVIKFSRVNRSLNEDINNSISIDSSPTKKGLKTAQEKNLLKKSIAICASFIFSWIFFDFLAIYEVTMHEEAPSIYHSFIDVVALAFPVVNFYILYHFDSTVKKNIRKLLKLD